MNRGYEKEYRILCVSGLNHRVGDATVRDGVLREFKKFGEVEAKLVLDSTGERLVYAYFRSPEDAREARHTKSKMVLFDKPVMVEPVYEAAEKRGRGPSRSSLSPDLGVGPYTSKSSGRARGGPPSPTRSTSSSGSLQQRRGHGREHPFEVPFRRDGSGGQVVAGHPDFLPPQGARRHDDKKEKFPNYLHHIPPEEDDKANRTLFVGNLEVNIMEPEVRRIFERYGVVEDVDIKRPPPGQGNAYAFVKFLNLDMAHKSKVEMSGQYVGKFQCKIGYGKPIPTTRIWVGGLGSWTSLSHLEREFDRFGAIKKIDFVKGENHAYILYDSIDAAQAACKEMRGFPLGGPGKRLRVDFADAGPYSYHQNASGGGQQQQTAATSQQRHNTYSVEEESYYRQRVDHEHGAMRGASAAREPYYYGRDAEYARWGSSSYYDPYYDRGGRSRIHDDWAGYERDHRQDDWAGWGGRDYWRDDGGTRGRADWPATAGDHQRRKRPRSPDDLHYDVGMGSSRLGSDHHHQDAIAYRRGYARQRSPMEGHLDASPQHLPHPGSSRRPRKSITPIPSRGFRSRDVSRERDLTPPGRPPGGGSAAMRERHLTRTARDSAMSGGERERPLRSSVAALRDERAENGGRMIRDGGSGGRGASPASRMLLLLPPLVPEAQAERLLRSGTLTEVTRIIPCTWQGGLVLKNSYFPVHMHACEGDAHIVDTLTKDAVSSESQVLRITQRLRLDQPKLDDVAKRLTGGGFCIFLGVAPPNEDQPHGPLPGGALVQQRPLRNLVSYLKQKEAAGVIALATTKDSQGVLYAFPPCRFSQERMRRVAPGLTDEGLKEDHLVIAVVRGAI